MQNGPSVRRHGRQAWAGCDRYQRHHRLERGLSGRPISATSLCVVALIVLGAEGFSSNGTVPGLLGFVFDLAWMIWLVVMAWQRPQAVRPLATAPAVAS